MKNILLIGSDGYIGSSLQLRLKHNPNYKLLCVDSGMFNLPNDFTIVTDYNELTKEFINHYDVVILLAGHSSVKMCEGNLINSHNNNVDNFINLVNKLDKTTKFIYASSSSVYGRCTSIADETYDNFIPYNNYDVTKHVIDLYIQRYDIEYYGLRFGTVNGYAPILRNDVMINAMYCSGKTNGEIKLYNKGIHRPILGINDLCRSIESIIESNTDNRGMYNLASFNKTSGEIAYEVGELINIPVVEYTVDPTTEITNSKLQTVCYDFKIDTTKFEKTFDFKFEDTIESIVNELLTNSFIETTRNKIIKYE